MIKYIKYLGHTYKLVAAASEHEHEWQFDEGSREEVCIKKGCLETRPHDCDGCENCCEHSDSFENDHCIDCGKNIYSSVD